LIKIIAGTHRGRNLHTLTGLATRPTTGKVKEALFNILQTHTSGRDWLDLFAGSGAIGFEAASRGARRVLLVESATPAIQVITRNQSALGLPQVELFARDVILALGWLAQHGQTFDVIFMDPPYDLNPLPVLRAIATHPALLRPDARIVLEHKTTTQPPLAIPGLQHQRTARYGISALSFYAPLKSPAEPDQRG
jgi:16S rRNA (guanine(966)-N(2))-methyltransferase RsmD